MLQGVIRKTWSIKGKTPIHIQSQGHQRISAISVITISPWRKHLNLIFRLYSHNITQEDVLSFLQMLKRKIRGESILILDNWGVHKAKKLKGFFAQNRTTMRPEWLPSYTPQLNPVEQLWNWCKYGDLHDFSPYDIQELNDSINNSLNKACSQQRLIRSFFEKPNLAL